MMAAWTAAAATPLADSQGSRRLDHFDEWLRKKGCRAAAWCQRTSSSASGSSRNPPTSAASKDQGFGTWQYYCRVWTESQPLEAKDVMLPPQKEIPARLRDSSMGTVIIRCSQLAVLSPVHTAPGPQPQKKTQLVTHKRKATTLEDGRFLGNTKSLRSSKEGAGEDEGSLQASGATQQTFHGGFVLWLGDQRDQTDP